MKLFVYSLYAKKLHVVDTDTDEVIDEKELDDFPCRLTRTSQNKLLVTHAHLPFQVDGRLEPGRLSVLDADTLEVQTTIDVGRTPIDQTVSADGSRVYVANCQAATVFEVGLEESVEVLRAVKTGPAGYASHGMLLL
jgi:DNA-binding beta-propeller fold protein YncE